MLKSLSDVALRRSSPATGRRSGERADGAGFTLLEVLVVIVVLGILAAVVVLNIGTVKGSAINLACETDLQTINQANTTYQVTAGSYATSKDQLLGSYLQSWPKNANYSVVLGTSGSAPQYSVVDPTGATVGQWIPGSTASATATAAHACNGLR